jgi:uncharacterized membrane protein
MTRIGAIRLGRVVLLTGGALAALATFFWTGSLMVLFVAFVGLLLLVGVVDRVWLRALSLEERRRALEDRVQNPPS